MSCAAIRIEVPTANGLVVSAFRYDMWIDGAKYVFVVTQSADDARSLIEAGAKDALVPRIIPIVTDGQGLFGIGPTRAGTYIGLNHTLETWSVGPGYCRLQSTTGLNA